MLYVNSSNELIFQNGSSSTTIGAAGGGSTPSWETMFTNDASFTLTPDATWTIAGNRNTATNVVTMTNVAGATGAILAFTNSTATNNDVLGTSSTWAVTGQGNATFNNVTLTGTTITSTTGDEAWTLRDNRSAALSIGASGDTNMMVFDTSNAAPLVVFNDGISMTDGNATFISTSNTVTNVLVTNNTITTFGANASSAGAVCIRSTSLTTGSLLQLQVSDTALAGGFYLTCRESVGGTNDFTIGENGVVTMAGTAGSDSFTMTLGDAVLSDGSLTMTDADNAATLSITNDTATTASVFVFAGSGTFTGNTTSSFMTLTASGLTSGTVLYMDAAALTTGKFINMTSATATDAVYVTLTGNTANQTTTSKMINIDLVANVAAQGVKIATTGVYTGTAGMVDLDAGAMTTGVLLSITSTTGLTSGSLIRATTSTAGALATSGAYSFIGTGDYTSASNVGLMNIEATTTAAGTILNVKGGALTTGVGVNIADAGTGTTSGSLLRVTSATTGAVATNGVVSFVGTGAHTSTASVGFVHVSDATASGIAVDITANALTTGSALLVTSSGTITSSSEGLVNVVGTGITTGSALKIDLTEATLTTGLYINCYDDTAAASVFSVGENGVVLFSDFTEVVTATNTITAAESGSVFFLSSGTEFASTLPTPQAGLHFTFIVSDAPSGASYTIASAAGTDNIHGVAVSAADAGGSVDTTAGTAADTITFVDGQALKGDMVDLYCDGTSWYARGVCSDEDAITFTAS